MNSRFYNEVLKAQNGNEISMIKVVESIMPIINKYSRNNSGQVDEELKAILIAKCIRETKRLNLEEFIKKYKFF